ncbi:GDSL-type esterase/lipase family protein [Stenotrophobium rhamnosiphilum]|uniref:GDSL family lipase n=1 Tax=Stenotrophobium rhamnosiphilum TaxID=2029166 RepID=A0A2T5MH13_9GAMM|nr:GDSL-type esterase/lipase family protein [Stenotrophobium rhamnosiphilum]PTU31874.1 GDSL family lipase [Stenotrophobium rhamnosiphilum]
MRNPIAVLLERLVMQPMWAQFRTGLESAAVPGSGGVLFLGDSITHIGRWDLMFPSIATRNFGISGERSGHLLERLGPIVSIKPHKIFILIGTNDLATKIKIEEIAANVAQLVDELVRALPDCKIYLQTVLPRANKFTARVKALNALYAEIAKQRRIELIDLFPLFDDGTGAIRKEVTNDKLHLMGPGYKIWRDAIEPLVLAA